MAFRLVDTNWWEEFERALRIDRSELRIVSPFIKAAALDRLLALGPEAVRVVTRYNLNDFAADVSDVDALYTLLAHGASVRGIRHLHAKLYVFGQSVAIVTSANLTGAGLASNPEFGVLVDDDHAIESCHRYFEHLWTRGRQDLARADVDAWKAELARHRAAGGGTRRSAKLPDYGVDGGLAEPSSMGIPAIFSGAGQGLVKFHGVAHDRAPTNRATFKELVAAGCHRVLAYPTGRRPQRVGDGDLMFIARLTRERGLSRIFGRAIAMKHQPLRDNATPADIERRSWMRQWSHFVRVHDAEFLNGTLANGISLGELIDALGVNSFVTTQERAARGKIGINPRLSVRQQPAVRLTQEARDWLNERLQAAFDRHGPLPPSALENSTGQKYSGVRRGPRPTTRHRVPARGESLAGRSPVSSRPWLGTHRRRRCNGARPGREASA